MIVHYSGNGTPFSCSHGRENTEFYMGVLGIGSVGFLLGLTDGTIPTILILFFFIAAIFGGGMLIWQAQTRDDWLRSEVNTNDLQSLEKLLKYAEQRNMELPRLPVSEPKQITNRILMDWCKSAKPALERAESEALLGNIRIPERYLTDK
jgi:hypothetical protein